MKTSEFKYYDFPFEEFNEPQSDVIPHVLDDKNLVVSFPTASGKSAIAEAVFSYVLQSDKKCIYVSPFRSLTTQKHDEWSKTTLSDRGIAVCTSDYATETTDFRSKGMLLFTMESFDSKTRSKAHHSWMKKVGVVVVDEAHLIGQRRGGSLELSLMRFTEFNKAARIVFLSATMPNAQQIADWLGFLNGKESLCFVSKWRPVKPTLNLYDAVDNWNELFEGVSGVVQQNVGKMIVFVHSKKMGSELGKYLGKLGIQCAFHHGSLSRSKRARIEKMFDDPEGLGVLISTSTLSSGVNL